MRHPRSFDLTLRQQRILIVITYNSKTSAEFFEPKLMQLHNATRTAFLHNVHKYFSLLVMKSQLIQMTFEVDLETEEKLKLPEHLTENLGAGKWLITIQPKAAKPIRNHAAFLNSYAEEDEGLYDDYPSR